MVVGEALTISGICTFDSSVLQRLCALNVLQAVKNEWTLLLVVDGSQEWATTRKQKQRSDLMLPRQNGGGNREIQKLGDFKA